MIARILIIEDDAASHALVRYLLEASGYQAVQTLREYPPWKKIPVIAVTAFLMTGDRDKALAAGLDEHIDLAPALRGADQGVPALVLAQPREDVGMSRWAVPEANPAVRSAEGRPISRWAVPEANPAVRSTEGRPISRWAVPEAQSSAALCAEVA